MSEESEYVEWCDKEVEPLVLQISDPEKRSTSFTWSQLHTASYNTQGWALTRARTQVLCEYGITTRTATHSLRRSLWRDLYKEKERVIWVYCL